ncbi:extracellular solute-binding protein [Pseudoclavibacter chungangensis]|uniref:Extracellular solute-binding protein n=1 Tax=Pseudoclavibacter chungangensis TaxID=587635 RepID=A0A7J5C459_9MICO|nr:extracellular solute-binding protein [Pseudoclavibacter chungangensis]KAB1662570.1 extracellular solute-binding protein [Pseudoclavibacter chungangensis]NYJ68615.1 putative spermidine/putrescine transport system substrate-binding protein [Pseudoclavibacter chungangensis]
MSGIRRAGAIALGAALVLSLAACGNTNAADEVAGGGAGTGATGDNIVITYNSPEQWGNFGNVLREFTADTGIQAPNDPKNSGQTLAALQAEKAAPVADVAYTGIAFADQLSQGGLIQPSTPAGVENIPADLKAADGSWYTVHTGTVAFIVNTDYLDGAPVPQSWDDLLKPEYQGKVGYLDPSQAAVGYSVATAANLAHGGDLDNWEHGLEYLSKLKDNGAVTPAQTATAKVSQGEIPILVDTDFNGYQLRDEGVNVEVVIPSDGSLQIPYVVAKVAGAPHGDNADKLLDFYFSEKGQSLFAEGYMRPVIGDIPAAMADKMLPAADYERAATIDYLKQGAVQADFVEQFTSRVGQ